MADAAEVVEVVEVEVFEQTPNETLDMENFIEVRWCQLYLYIEFFIKIIWKSSCLQAQIMFLLYI